MERVQNPFLRKALQNKIRELTAAYGEKIGECKANLSWHSDVVESICAEKFDRRLHGTSNGRSYDQGTYFFTDAAASHGYCLPNSTGLKYLFVAVGSLTQDYSSKTRPPFN